MNNGLVKFLVVNKVNVFAIYGVYCIGIYQVSRKNRSPTSACFAKMTIYLITSTIWCGTHNRGGLQLKRVLSDNPPTPGLRPLLFSNSGGGSFTFHKNRISESAVRRDLRFFVLIRED